MPVVTHYPTTNAVVTTGWTNPNNAHGNDGVYATAAPGKNATVDSDWKTFGFDAAVPVGATINSVTVEVEWKVSTTASVATLGSQVYVGGVAQGTEFTNTAEPTADTIQSYAVSGLTRDNLLDANFAVRVRTSRGNNNNAVTGSLDFVRVIVDYTEAAPPGSKTVTMVVNDPAVLTAGDTAIRDRLVNRGWTVTFVSDDAAQDSTARSLTLVAESVASGTMGTKYSTLAQPAVVLEPFVSDAWNLITVDPPAPSANTTARVHTSHPCGAGLAIGSYSIAASGSMAFIPTANVVAAGDKFLTDDAVPTSVFGFAVESGAAILNGATAAARRVVLGWLDNIFSGTPTADGWAIFDASCDWAANISDSTPVAASDTQTVSVTDAVATLSASLTRPDTISISLVESASIVVTVERADTTSVGVTDAGTVLLGLDAVDTTTVGLIDTAAVAAVVAAADSPTASIADVVSTTAVSVPVSDAATVSVTEARTLGVTVSTSDTATVAVTEAAAAAAQLAAADTTSAGVAESMVLNVSVLVSDSTSLSLTESQTSLLSSSVSDSIAVALAEALTIATTVVTSDTASVSLVDTSAVEASGGDLLSVVASDSAAVGTGESTSILASVSVGDTIGGGGRRKIFVTVDD